MSDGSVNAEPPRRHSPGWAATRRRGTELLIVFVGVYAAFLLNRMDTDRRDAKRRVAILDAVEREMSSEITEFRENLAQVDVEFAEFNRQLAAGEMPRLGIVYTNSNYSAVDDATLLQSGGLELLDMETVELLRKVDSLQRSLVEGSHNQFELSLATLTNHNQDDFYDPATHQLKPQFRWYPIILRDTIKNAKDALAAQETLLAHIRAMQNPSATPVPSPAGRTTPSRNPTTSTPAA